MDLNFYFSSFLNLHTHCHWEPTFYYYWYIFALNCNYFSLNKREVTLQQSIVIPAITYCCKVRIINFCKYSFIVEVFCHSFNFILRTVSLSVNMSWLQYILYIHLIDMCTWLKMWQITSFCNILKQNWKAQHAHFCPLRKMPDKNISP